VRVAAVALARRAVVELRFEPFEPLVEDHVDDACDRVRAVRGRRAARHDLGPLHEHRGDQREVHGTAFRLRDHALRVDERECARAEERIEAAQVRKLRAHVEVADADVRLGEERRVLRQRPQHVSRVDDAEVLDLLGIDRRQRLRRIEPLVAHARASNDDLLVSLT
jgi:hypothetical protein